MRDEIERNENLYNSIKGNNNKLKRSGTKMNFDKNSLADVIWRRQERESGGENSNDH